MLFFLLLLGSSFTLLYASRFVITSLCYSLPVFRCSCFSLPLQLVSRLSVLGFCFLLLLISCNFFLMGASRFQLPAVSCFLLQVFCLELPDSNTSCITFCICRCFWFSASCSPILASVIVQNYCYECVDPFEMPLTLRGW